MEESKNNFKKEKISSFEEFQVYLQNYITDYIDNFQKEKFFRINVDIFNLEKYLHNHVQVL
jgi:hypothetical protein